MDLALCGDFGNARAGQTAGLPADKQVSARGIEVGTSSFRHQVFRADEGGGDRAGRQRKAGAQGSYGIGPSRLVAAIIEACHDEAGIKWPEAVAPFQSIMLNLKQGDAATDAACEQLYRALTAAGVDALYHDGDDRPGAKFATADLIGIPWQILVGPKGPRRGQGRAETARGREPRAANPRRRARPVR